MGTGGGRVVIDFSENGNSAYFRHEGWSGQEPDRVWGIGPRSVLAVPIQSSGRPIVLEAELAPGQPSPNITGQIVRVAVNGTNLGSVRIDGRSMIRTEIDPVLVCQDGVLKIEFGFPGFHRPDWSCDSSDERPLSCWFSFVRVYTLDMFKPGPWFPTSHPDIPIVRLLPPFAVAAVANADAVRATYTFGPSGTAIPFLGDGWDAGEGDHTSTVGSVSQLILPAPTFPDDYALQLDVRAPEVPATVREVTVILDRIVIDQFSLIGSTIWSGPLPRELTEGRDRLPLTLVVSDTTVPHDPAAPSETSHLGVAIVQMAIVPMSSCTASTEAASGISNQVLTEDGVMPSDTAEKTPGELVTRGLDSHGINGELAGHKVALTRGTDDDGGLIGDRMPMELNGSGVDEIPVAANHCNGDTDDKPGVPPNAPEESPRDVANWVRNLALRAPWNIRGVFQLLGRFQYGQHIASLLNTMDFSDTSPEELFQIVIGRPPVSNDFDTGTIDADACATFGRSVLSREFRERSFFAFLEAFPELARDIFIHVPKSAGTDLIMNLSRRQRLMPLPYMLIFPGWISDDEFLSVLSGLTQGVPFHDRIFVYGHMNLGEFPPGFQVRSEDSVFSIIRDPLIQMVSNANYAVGRLRQDPEGHDPDTAETLRILEMPRLPDGLSDRELKDLVVRVLLEPSVVFPNDACRHLRAATGVSFKEAIANIVANDIEITTTDHYESWLRDRWGILHSERYNRSDTILTEREARLLYSRILRYAAFEDQKLFNLVT